jgi:hypothetical protein
MSGKVTDIDSFTLSGTKNGVISVTKVDEPYGEGTPEVVSIGISLSGKGEPDWKVHLPKENIDQVIAALEKAK